MCGKVRYTLKATPLVVHACHCTQCQHVSGSAFVMNAVIGKGDVDLQSGTLKAFHFEHSSHTTFSCDQCATNVWSEYAGYFKNCWFVRVGTLDDANLFPPDVHIFTSTRQPWVVLDDGTPCYTEFYPGLKAVWSAQSLQRFAELNESPPPDAD